MDVNKAIDLCQSMGAGRVVIETEKKQNLIDSLFQSKNYWLSLTDSSGQNKEFAWHRADGTSERLTPNAYTNWFNNEPNNGYERWVVNYCKNGKCGWFDINHDHEAEVICQKSKAGIIITYS